MIASAEELLNVGEEGIAFENLVNNLFEVGVQLSDEAFLMIDAMGRQLGLDPQTWSCLRSQAC